MGNATWGGARHRDRRSRPPVCPLGAMTAVVLAISDQELANSARIRHDRLPGPLWTKRDRRPRAYVDSAHAANIAIARQEATGCSGAYDTSCPSADTQPLTQHFRHFVVYEYFDGLRHHVGYEYDHCNRTTKEHLKLLRVTRMMNQAQ